MPHRVLEACSLLVGVCRSGSTKHQLCRAVEVGSSSYQVVDRRWHSCVCRQCQHGLQVTYTGDDDSCLLTYFSLPYYEFDDVIDNPPVVASIAWLS